MVKLTEKEKEYFDFDELVYEKGIVSPVQNENDIEDDMVYIIIPEWLKYYNKSKNKNRLQNVFILQNLDLFHVNSCTKRSFDD